MDGPSRQLFEKPFVALLRLKLEVVPGVVVF